LEEVLGTSDPLQQERREDVSAGEGKVYATSKPASEETPNRPYEIVAPDASDPAEDRLFEHFAVTPDMQSEPFALLGRTGAPEDPFVSQGITTSTCFVLPRTDAFPLVTVHKVSGALAEMERLLSFLGASQPQPTAPTTDSVDADQPGNAKRRRRPTVSRSPSELEESELSENDGDDRKDGVVVGVDGHSSISMGSSAPADQHKSPAVLSFLDEQGSTMGDDDVAAGALLRAYVRVYFVILDVVYALDIESKALEKELVETALAMYRVCVERISLRNRIPEAFAVACVLLASERLAARCALQQSQATTTVPRAVNNLEVGSSQVFTHRAWDPSFVKRVVSAAEPVWPQASLTLVYDYMRRVLNTLLERRPDTVEAVGHEMPKYCELLGVNAPIAELAHSIAERAVIHGVCARRTSVSVCAAAIYLAAHLEDARRVPSSASSREQVTNRGSVAAAVDSTRLKQRDIADRLQLSEVTLRKAHKEILTHLDLVLPPDYRPSRSLKRCLPPSYQRVAAAALQRIANSETTASSEFKQTPAITRPSSATNMSIDANDNQKNDVHRADEPAETVLHSPVQPPPETPGDAALSEYQSDLDAGATLDAIALQQPTAPANIADVAEPTADASLSGPNSTAPTFGLPRAIGPGALMRHWGISISSAKPGAAGLRALLLQSGIPVELIDRIVEAAIAGTLPMPISLLLSLIESGCAPPLPEPPLQTTSSVAANNSTNAASAKAKEKPTEA
jgi:transcription initiation factor TFIIIB Brf1 subunit/transcription initiation factor TFIIB